MTACDVRATMNGSHGEMVLVPHGLRASARGRKIERKKEADRGGRGGGAEKGREGGEGVGRVDGE